MPDEKNKRQIFLAGNTASYVSLIAGALLGFIGVRISLNYFGPTAYGIWLVLQSIVGYLQMSNFGLGFTTTNLVAQARDINQQRAVIRRTLFLLLSSSVAICLALIVAFKMGFWGSSLLGKVPANMKDTASNVLFLVIILTLAQVPFCVVTGTFSGLQKIHWNRLYGSFVSAGSFAGLCITVWLKGGLVMLALLTGAGALIVNLISALHLLIKYPHIVRGKVQSGHSYAKVISLGLRFLALSIGAIVVLNSGNVIISNALGPENVVPFSVIYKLYFTSMMLLQITTGVLWPMYAKAMGEGNWDWINKTHNANTQIVTLLSGFLWVAGVLFFKDIVHVWLGPHAYGGALLVLFFGGYAYMVAFAGSNLTLLNALNPTNVQVMISAVDATLTLILSFALVHRLGIAGIGAAMFLSCTIVHCWFPVQYIRRRTHGKVRVKQGSLLKHSAIALFPAIIISMAVNRYIELLPLRMAVSLFVMGLYAAISWRFLYFESRANIVAAFRAVLGKVNQTFRYATMFL